MFIPCAMLFCMEQNYHLDTLLVHGGYDPKEHNRSRMTPIYQTSAFCYDSTDHAESLFSMDESGFIYSRIGNPTVDAAEKRIALVEGGIGAVGFASGMAAVTAFLLNFLKPGDVILASDCLYGGTFGLLQDTLPTLGIHTRFFDPLKAETLEAVISPECRLVFVENLANPALVIPDYEGITEVCRRHRLPLAVDNTIATPFLTNPFSYGADFIIHSCTKYMEGHGSIIGGMVVDGGRFSWDGKRYPLLFEAAPGGKSYVEKYGKDAFLMRLRGKVQMNTGGCMAPMNAFLLLHGLESLHVRMERHCRNAAEIAATLAGNAKIAWVNYPGLETSPSHKNAKKYLRPYFGAMIGFGLKGGYDACKSFIDRVELLSHSTNIGDTKTLIIHPASTTHRNMDSSDRLKAGIGDDFIRMSVGLENAADLLYAMEKAMA
jgi:O-acetylhomoserine (thiol)-lyase